MKSYQIPFKLYSEDHLRVYEGKDLLVNGVDYKIVNNLTRVVELRTLEDVKLRRLTQIPDGDIFTSGYALDAETVNRICDIIEASILDMTNGQMLEGFLDPNNNLSDLSSVIEARSFLDVYSKGEIDSLLSTYCKKNNNLLELLNKATSRSNLDVYSRAEWDAVLEALGDAIFSREDFELDWVCNVILELDSGYDVTITPFKDGRIVADFDTRTQETPTVITVGSSSNTTYYIYATTTGFSYTTDTPTVLFNGKLGYGVFPDARLLVGIARTGTTGVIDVRSVFDPNVQTKEYITESEDNTFAVLSGDVIECTVSFDVVSNDADVDLNVEFAGVTESNGTMSQDVLYSVTALITCDAEEDTAINVFPTICDGETEFEVSNLSIVSVRKPYGWRQTVESGFTTTINLTVTEQVRTKIFSWKEDVSSDAFGWDEGEWNN